MKLPRYLHLVPVYIFDSTSVLEFEDEDDDEYEDERLCALPYRRSISIQLMRNRLFFIAPGLITDLRITDN